ncbi:hypothetical protein OSTOST_08592 [Ostertagia ostertagi]
MWKYPSLIWPAKAGISNLPPSPAIVCRSVTKPVYILGTGLSHDGSACILKDGRIAVAIEKERLTRIKHDGGNDAAAVQYCLDALNIPLTDLDLIVQVANFEKEISPQHYAGKRLYHADVPVVTISHHLAHAWSAIATSPFQATNVLVIDGAGSPAAQCDDWPDEATRQYWCSLPGFYCEKDKCRLFDQSAGGLKMPTTYHSIGGIYAAASHYCFGNLDDVGKLMGLAPYGHDPYTHIPIFSLEGGTVQVRHENMAVLRSPAADYPAFKANFQHYADVARWVQKETERAVLYIAGCRMKLSPHENLCYAGGVALNAVCNQQLLLNKVANNLYLQPAAGDNDGTISIDKDKLKYPGDLLHEAGHIAVVPFAERKTLNAETLGKRDNHPAEEMMAMAWSYAACVHLHLNARIVFHKDGYQGGSDNLLQSLTSSSTPIGSPMLQYVGMSMNTAFAKENGIPPYPHMIRWTRE